MYIAFDIGGTKMRIAASKDRKRLMGEPVVENTPDDFDRGIQFFCDIVRELARGENIEAVAGGIAGSLNREKTELVNAPNMQNWVGKPLKDSLSRQICSPVYLENDTAMVGLGEAYAGSGMGYDIVVYITVSTGVGGVRIVNGTIDKGKMGFEPGHQIIDVDNTLCKNCRSGQLEDMISGTATSRRFGVPAYEVNNPKVWNTELPKWLAYGLYNTMLHWSPDVIVLGGSMIIGNPAINLAQTEQYLRELNTVFHDSPLIKAAECGNFGGIHGGFAYLRQILDTPRSGV